MRQFFGLLIVAAAVILGVGFWRGWFIVDRERINEDSKQAIEKVRDTSDSILKKDKSD